MVLAMPRSSCHQFDDCHAAGRGGLCRICDAEAIAQRAVTLRERIASDRAEGRPPYAPRPFKAAEAKRISEPDQ